jgi:hypothetical protein
MRAWVFSAVFAAIGAALGTVAASGAGVTSAQPLWALSGGAWLAILGAVLGGTADILRAVTEAGRQGRPVGQEFDRRRSDT